MNQKNIAKQVTHGFEKIQNAFLSRYTKIEDAFVARYLLHEGETIQEAKLRLKEKENKQ